MRKIFSCFVLVVLFTLAFQCAEAQSSNVLDYTISEEINMCAPKGSVNLMIDPLVIKNNSNLYEIGISKVGINTVDGWSLVSYTTNFEELEADSNYLSIYTEDEKDLWDETMEFPKIKCNEASTIYLCGKISKMSSEAEKHQIADLVVEIDPFLESKTVIYEDGTMIINELENKSLENMAVHGGVVRTYDCLDSNNPYEFSAATKQPWKLDRYLIKKVEFGSYVEPKSMAYWFYGCTNLSEFYSENLDVSSCTSTYMMFYQAGKSITEKFKLVGLDEWDVSNVVTFAGMFNQAGYGAKNWDIGDLSNWKLSSAENLSNMFNQAGYTATEWYAGNLGKWDTSKVKQLNGTFKQTGELSNKINLGDLGGWNTSKVEDMSNLFYKTGYSAAEWKIGDISKWDLSNVITSERMFYNAAYSAELVDIGQLDWKLESVVIAKQMFYNFAISCSEVDLGTLTIYDTGSFVSFMQNGSGFIATINVAEELMECDSMFKNAATNEQASIRLIPLKDSAVSWCQEIVGLYGIEGSVSKGNIWI